MNATRRDALKAAALAVGVAAAGTRGARAQDTLPMPPLDYGRSFICNSAEFNQVRFWVESRTRLIDDETGAVTDCYQCGSCKSENTFAEKDLFMADNYDFLPIWGGGYWLVFRQTVRLAETYRMISTPDEKWGEPILKLQEAKSYTVLESWEAIRDANAEALPLVTQTELNDERTGLRAIIECPTKTMNVSIPKRMYQVDTGPVGYPDLSKRHDPPVDCLKLAFIAFNAPDFAAFVVEQPTHIEWDNPDSPQTYHYSNPFSVPATNRVIALNV